jgi:hypothetical protein
VLFAHLDRIAPRAGEAGDRRVADVSWVPDPRDRVALVADLPGAESVRYGLALAERGYRPVPLFNANVGPSPVVDVETIALHLLRGADVLRAARLEPDAPPAFLLDADRMATPSAVAPGKFDNRWIVLPQDFPSATFLRARGIGEVWLLQAGRTEPREDLAHILLRWQRAGIRLFAGDVLSPGRPRELDVKPPSRFRRAWYRAIALLGLRRSNAGGFGGVVPVITSGG